MHPWFCLLTRLLGLFLVLSYGAPILGEAVPLIVALCDDSYTRSRTASGIPVYVQALVSHSTMLIPFIFGLYLLFGGVRLNAWLARDLANLCSYCGYNISQVAGDACPECGARLPRRMPLDSAHAPDHPA
ncbi:hypothetical protein BH11PLA1_BH11PLA1_14540 [soil metagenome]